MLESLRAKGTPHEKLTRWAVGINQPQPLDGNYADKVNTLGDGLTIWNKKVHDNTH